MLFKSRVGNFKSFFLQDNIQLDLILPRDYYL